MPESLTSAFGARGHDGAVVVADDDIADTNGDANPPCPFDLGAADLDGVAVTDVLLDRCRKPRRRHVEIDRAGAQPPPQAAEAAGEDYRQRRNDDRKPPDPTFADNPPLQRGEFVADPVDARTRPRQQPARAMAGSLVMLPLPRVIVPLPGGRAGGVRRLLLLGLGRRIPRHGFPLPTLTMGLVGALAAPVARVRPLLCGHRCQSLVSPVAHHLAK